MTGYHNSERQEVNITYISPNKVTITSGFLLVMAALTVLCGGAFTLMALLAAAVHEQGHLGCIALCGGQVRGFRLCSAGAELEIGGRFSYWQDALIALSGPFAGALLAGAALCAGELTGAGWAYALFSVSLFYSLLNLLPAGELDGGRAMYAVCCQLFGPAAAGRVRRIFDLLISALLLGAGIYVFFASKGNISALICAFFVIKGCCKSVLRGVE